jgi:hypothetical protein
MSLYRWRCAIAHDVAFSADVDRRQFELEALDMSGRANIGEQMVRLAELAFMPSSTGRWVAAVNADGRCGEWRYVVAR